MSNILFSIQKLQKMAEPLFNRADRILMIKPFSILTMADILHDYKIKDTATVTAQRSRQEISTILKTS